MDQADSGGATPLGIACHRGHTSVVCSLVVAGADINQPNDFGCTPIFIACQEGHMDIVQLLIEAEADIHRADVYNWNPAHAASYGGHTEVLSVLVIEGIDVGRADDDNLTARELVAFEGLDTGLLAAYEAAFSSASLTAAKLRFGRTLLEETIIPAMIAVNGSTSFLTHPSEGDDETELIGGSSELAKPTTTCSSGDVDVVDGSVDLRADIFWHLEVVERVFGFLDRHGLVGEEE